MSLFLYFLSWSDCCYLCCQLLQPYTQMSWDQIYKYWNNLTYIHSRLPFERDCQGGRCFQSSYSLQTDKSSWAWAFSKIFTSILKLMKIWFNCLYSCFRKYQVCRSSWSSASGFCGRIWRGSSWRVSRHSRRPTPTPPENEDGAYFLSYIILYLISFLIFLESVKSLTWSISERGSSGFGSCHVSPGSPCLRVSNINIFLLVL